MSAFIPLARLSRIGPLPSTVLRGGTPRTVEIPDGQWDIIAVSVSGGKDSQAALYAVVQAAARVGKRDRVVAIHADLGPDEWDGTTDLVRAQCEALGITLHVCSRIGQVKKGNVGELYRDGDVFGDMHDYVLRRKQAHVERRQAAKPAWYSPANRWCTSEFKRSPIRSVLRKLAREDYDSRFQTIVSRFPPEPTRKDQARLEKSVATSLRPTRVLSVQGMRAEESGRRAKLPAFAREAAMCSPKRECHVWLPLHAWTEAEVWATIHESGLPYHWAYQVGMGRLSCSLCMFAPRDLLLLAGHYNRKRLAEKVDVEVATGDTFKSNLALADVLEDVDAGKWPARAGGWVM